MFVKSLGHSLRTWNHWGMVIGRGPWCVALGFFATRAQGAEQPSVYRGASAVAVRTAAAVEGQIDDQPRLHWGPEGGRRR